MLAFIPNFDKDQICLYNISIPINFHQNRFINECAFLFFFNVRNYRKKDFFVKCRRTFLINFIHISLLRYNNCKKKEIYGIQNNMYLRLIFGVANSVNTYFRLKIYVV